MKKKDNEAFFYDFLIKLFLYKKVFLCIFFTILFSTGLVALLSSQQHKFTQFVRITNCCSYFKESHRSDELISCIKKIENIFIPRVVRLYNLKAQEKIDLNSIHVYDVGGNTFALSAFNDIKKLGVYKLLFQQIIEHANLDYKIGEEGHKLLVSEKKTLERRLNSLMKEGESKSNILDIHDLSKRLNLIETIEAQIYPIKKVEPYYEMLVNAVGPSKLLLLSTIILVALSIALSGILIIDFFRNLIPKILRNAK
jgi:hypothetical protein